MCALQRKIKQICKNCKGADYVGRISALENIEEEGRRMRAAVRRKTVVSTCLVIAIALVALTFFVYAAGFGYGSKNLNMYSDEKSAASVEETSESVDDTTFEGITVELTEKP